MDTCSTCRNFVRDIDVAEKGFGSCLFMQDANDFNFYDFTDFENQQPSTDRCYGWDFESYKAGVHVGENFGCIHWEKLNGSNDS